MASKWDIELRLPRILFLDGSFATIYRTGIPEGTPEKAEMTLLPNAPTIRAGNLLKDMTRLNEPSPVLSIHNNLVYKQNYNTDYILPLSRNNPEWNVSLGLCNIKGQKISIGHKDFIAFYKLQEKIVALQEHIKSQDLEIARLRKRNRKLVLSTTKSLREEMGLAREETIRKVLPDEFTGYEFGKKEGEK